MRSLHDASGGHNLFALLTTLTKASIMRLSLTANSVLLLSLCTAFFAFAQAQKTSPSASRFRQAAKASSNNILQLSALSEFDALVSSQRDYSISLLLSAVDSPPVQCGPCKMFQPTYESIANGFRKAAKGDAVNQHIFSYLEFKDGREVFQKLQLQYAPVLLYFPPTIGPRATPKPDPEQYDFNRLGFEGEDVAADISKRVGIPIPFSKPFPWQLVGTAAAGAITLAILCVFVLPPLTRAIAGGQADSLFQPKVILGFLVKAVILATITVMCAGHMWNGIRNAPYVTSDGSGKPQYFASGFQNQNAAETQIIAVIYGILSFSVVSLAVLVPTQRDPVKQRAAIYVWSAILLSAFSLLFYVFRLKNPSYPFRLFF